MIRKLKNKDVLKTTPALLKGAIEERPWKAFLNSAKIECDFEQRGHDCFYLILREGCGDQQIFLCFHNSTGETVPRFVPSEFVCADSITPLCEFLFKVFHFILHRAVWTNLNAQCFLAGCGRKTLYLMAIVEMKHKVIVKVSR